MSPSPPVCSCSPSGLLVWRCGGGPSLRSTRSYLISGSRGRGPRGVPKNPHWHGASASASRRTLAASPGHCRETPPAWRDVFPGLRVDLGEMLVSILPLRPSICGVRMLLCRRGLFPHPRNPFHVVTAYSHINFLGHGHSSSLRNLTPHGGDSLPLRQRTRLAPT